MRLLLSFSDYLIHGFSRHLALVLVLLLVGGIVFARTGRALGIDRLFWHERGSVQFRAGVATTLLLAKVGFVGCLLDAPRLARIPEFANALPAYAAALYLLLFAPPVVVLWSVLGLVAVRVRGGVPETPRIFFVLGALFGFAAGVASILVFAWLVPPQTSLPSWLVQLLLLGDVPTAQRPLHVLAAFFMFALSLEYLAYALSRQLFTPAMAICTLLGLITGMTGFLEFRGWNSSAVALSLLGLLALGGLPSYKVRLSALRARYSKPVALVDYPALHTSAAPAPLRSQDVLWSRGGRARPLVLVCASGGGLRSALWTAEVLAELELALHGFSSSLRIVAGASGGMVGASAYVLSLAPGERSGERWAHQLPREQLVERLGRDSLSATIEQLVFHDLLFAGLPLANWSSRGDALEQCWRAALGPTFDASFGELVARERAGELPSLVFSPMLVEDGRRLLISNLELDFLVNNQVTVADQARSFSRSGFELARLFPDDFDRFPVSTAARLSAAFPYVSPAVSLPTTPRRRVVDAGYYDNYGVNVCAAWLAEAFCSEALRRWLEQHVSRVLVVQLRDEVSPLQGSGQLEKEPGLLRRGLEGLSSPVQGVLSSRQAVSLFRNDEQLKHIIQVYDDGFEPGFVRTEIFAFPGEASLSWYLSRAERAAISRAARTLGLNDLRAFWQGKPSTERMQMNLHIANADDVHGGER
jgi:Patatin-like phospholipase